MAIDRGSYRDRFQDAAEAESYDRGEYAERGYAGLLWRIEQECLRDIVVGVRSTGDQVRYLDFACGTGRVLAFMEPLVDEAEGVEISPAMLDLARTKVRSASLVLGDITSDPGLVHGPFDLITAFRFVLNAEPDLRRSALRCLAGLLRDERSCLVFNSHINLWSYKLATWPSQRFPRSRPEGRGNFLTMRAVRRLAADCGLVVERVCGCGFLSRRALRMVDYEKLLAAERRLAQIPWLRPFGADQIYVARRMR